MNITPEKRSQAIVGQMSNKAGMVSADAIWLEQATTEAIQAESNAQLLRNRAVDRQADVAAFVRKFGQPMRETPGWPKQEDLDMRARLIAEEFCEFLKDCGYTYHLIVERFIGEDPPGTPKHEVIVEESRVEPIDYPDLPGAADGLIDMEYVILGTHVTLGINSTPLWQEVQRANMAKEGGAKREDGKICKPQNWCPPDIEGALRKQGWMPLEVVS